MYYMYVDMQRPSSRLMRLSLLRGRHAVVLLLLPLRLLWWCRPAKYSFSLYKINSAALALVERISINNIDHLFHQ